jgi:hypothetical protein
MMRRLLAIGLVWLGCALAWGVLGSTLMMRSGETSSSLTREVERMWGPEIAQLQPRAAIPIERSDVRVKLHLEQRRKGLNWFPTYTVELTGQYNFASPHDSEQTIDFEIPLLADAIYEDLEVRDEAGNTVKLAIEPDRLSWQSTLAARATKTWTLSYRSRGTTRWLYDMRGAGRDVKAFHLTVDTNFANVDFPTATTSPTKHETTANGWHGEWSFRSLVAAEPIGIEMPKRLNPGPLAAKITFFAPVGLLFFFFVVGVLAAARTIALHPMHFFFLGCGFFAFHLLFAYLVDHLPIALSFALAAASSIGLVVSYARLFVGWRFALREMGIAQLVYLVLFSFTFFWSGFTGLAITVGAVITLAIIMQITGRVQWGAPRELPEPEARACAAPYRCAASVDAAAP